LFTIVFCFSSVFLFLPSTSSSNFFSFPIFSSSQLSCFEYHYYSLCSEACSLVWCYNNKMPTEFSSSWPATVVLLFSYLTTIPFWKATRILALWNQQLQTLPEFSLNVINGIPPQFFLRTQI
jgi:hypothetical protein